MDVARRRRRAREDVPDVLLHPDRPARRPPAHRHRRAGSHDRAGPAELVFARLLHPHRSLGALLALCRYCLDFFAAAVVFGWYSYKLTMMSRLRLSAKAAIRSNRKSLL